MIGDRDWEKLYAQSIFKEFGKFYPVNIPYHIESHTIEIEVKTGLIKPTWKTAGYLYQLLDNPLKNNNPKSGSKHLIDVNIPTVIQLPKLTDKYWLQYRPHRWFNSQRVTFRYWRYG